MRYRPAFPAKKVISAVFSVYTKIHSPAATAHKSWPRKLKGNNGRNGARGWPLARKTMERGSSSDKKNSPGLVSTHTLPFLLFGRTRAATCVCRGCIRVVCTRFTCSSSLISACPPAVGVFVVSITRHQVCFSLRTTVERQCAKKLELPFTLHNRAAAMWIFIVCGVGWNSLHSLHYWEDDDSMGKNELENVEGKLCNSSN